MTLSLRSFERVGLVTHTITSSIPRVDCAFAPLGTSPQGRLPAIGEWASANADAIEEARTRFEAVKCGAGIIEPIDFRTTHA